MRFAAWTFSHIRKTRNIMIPADENFTSNTKRCISNPSHPELSKGSSTFFNPQRLLEGS
jgi:hypothetical protein